MNRATCAAACLVVLMVGCSSDESGRPLPDGPPAENTQLCLDAPRGDLPVVGLIDDALAAVTDFYGRPIEFFEVSADTQRVSVIAAIEGVAEQAFYCGDLGLTPPEVLGDADPGSATFAGDAVDFDPAVIFDSLGDELDGPTIDDFAIVGDGDGGVVYDANVVSGAGGSLLVLLGADGSILGVRAE